MLVAPTDLAVVSINRAFATVKGCMWRLALDITTRDWLRTSYTLSKSC